MVQLCAVGLAQPAQPAETKALRAAEGRDMQARCHRMCTLQGNAGAAFSIILRETRRFRPHSSSCWLGQGRPSTQRSWAPGAANAQQQAF